jgi:hypothetical protein
MKKITLSCLAIVAAATTFGQVILLDHDKNIVTNTIIDINIASNANSTEEILVKNGGTITDTLKVLRTVYSVDANDQTQFCFGGLCYAHATNLSSLSISVAPGDTIDYSENGFHAIFDAGVACVTRLVKYRFFNVNNFSDSASVTFRYSCVTGIDDNKNTMPVISNPSPNPAYGYVSFNYSTNTASEKAKIVIHDMLGKAVKIVDLTEREGSVKINTSDLISGVYFYSYYVDNKTIATKKMIIAN